MPVPLVYVDGKIKNDRSFTCIACGVDYPSIADLGYMTNQTGSKYFIKHICKSCEKIQKKRG